ALVHDPSIILLDEPLSLIDETGRGELISILQELRAMGKTLVIASPAPAEVAEVCDTLTALVDGRLESPNEVENVVLTWIEIVSELGPALRTLRELPDVDDVREENGFVTFRGPTTPGERAQVLDLLVGNGVRLAGFGATTAVAGGRE